MKNRGSTAKDLLAREDGILEIKKRLIQQREELLLSAGAVITQHTTDPILSELGDQASADIDKNFMFRLKGRERQLLIKIDESLEKIENHTYGICDICGEEIGIERLNARPVTTMCIACKTDQEEGERTR